MCGNIRPTHAGPQSNACRGEATKQYKLRRQRFGTKKRNFLNGLVPPNSLDEVWICAYSFVQYRRTRFLDVDEEKIDWIAFTGMLLK
jgi:hypothetical protein